MSMILMIFNSIEVYRLFEEGRNTLPGMSMILIS